MKKETTKTFKKSKTIKDSQFARIKEMSIDELSKFLCKLHACFGCPMYEACDNLGNSANGWKVFLESEGKK